MFGYLRNTCAPTVLSHSLKISSVPVITSTGKDVMNYSFFNRCIQQTAELLVVLDPRLEETVKVRTPSVSCLISTLYPLLTGLRRVAGTVLPSTALLAGLLGDTEMSPYRSSSHDTSSRDCCDRCNPGGGCCAAGNLSEGSSAAHVLG